MKSIVKLLQSKNKEDCLLGYTLLRRKYRFLPLWIINRFILHRYGIHLYIASFPVIDTTKQDVFQGIEKYLVISILNDISDFCEPDIYIKLE